MADGVERWDIHEMPDHPKHKGKAVRVADAVKKQSFLRIGSISSDQGAEWTRQIQSYQWVSEQRFECSGKDSPFPMWTVKRVLPHSIDREVGYGERWRRFTKTVMKVQLMSWPELSEGLSS